MTAAFSTGVCSLICLIASFSFGPAPADASIAPGTGRRGFLEPGTHVSILEKELKLQLFFDEVRKRDSEGRVPKIELQLALIFQSLPKNQLGRIAPRAVRYIIHHYFIREHGWLLTGLEPHGHHPRTTEIHEVSIMKDKAPGLADAIFSHRGLESGLTLGDTVALVAAIEQLVLDESRQLLGAAYYLNGKCTLDRLNEVDLDEVLFSYLIMYEMGESRNLLDIQDHMEMRSRAMNPDVELIFDDLLAFQNDTVKSAIFSDRSILNPFLEKPYTFKDATRFVTRLVESYSAWQDQECWRMKSHLVAMSVPGTGLIPLATFYAEQGASEYRFSESKTYLRAIGALDESTSSVRIANYLPGPSNCLASSDYFAVCCLSECDRLTDSLMRQVQAPVTSPDDILRIVSNMSTATVDGPRAIGQEMQLRLQRIADAHDGDVPLHGRRFAQWMHNAFPNECPYPHKVIDRQVLTMNRWKDSLSTASDSEIEQIMKEEEMWPAALLPQAPHWVEDVVETMPLQEPVRRPKRGNPGSNIFRLGVQISLLLVGIRTAYSWSRAAARAAAARSGAGKAEKSAAAAGAGGARGAAFGGGLRGVLGSAFGGSRGGTITV